MGGFINDGTYKFFDEWYAQEINPGSRRRTAMQKTLEESRDLATKVVDWLLYDMDVTEETTPEEFMKKLLEEDAKHPNKPAHHKELMSSFKEQVAGSHYKELPIQPIEFITKNDLSFIVGNIIKYACRADKKGGADDIKKCIHYARMLLEQKYNVKSEITFDEPKR